MGIIFCTYVLVIIVTDKSRKLAILHNLHELVQFNIIIIKLVYCIEHI